MLEKELSPAPWPWRAAWNHSACFLRGTRACLLSRARCHLPPVGHSRSAIPVGGTLVAQERAAAAAGAVLLGALWVQWGRTGSAARPRARQLHAACGTAVIEAAVSSVFLTDWWPWRPVATERVQRVRWQRQFSLAHTCPGLAWLLRVAGEAPGFSGLFCSKLQRLQHEQRQ